MVLALAYPPRILGRLKADVLDRAATVVDLGCGTRKFPAAIGVEMTAGPAVDVVHDLNRRPFQARVPRPLVSWENDWCFLVRGGEMPCLLRKPEPGPS